MKLWLIRHAKSDWSSPGVSDFQRPLNARGERDGPRMATWLTAQDGAADWLWSSDALRAQQTAAFVAQAFAISDGRWAEDHRLYGAGPETLLSVIRETPPDVLGVAVVAHNPGMTELVNLLAGDNVTGNLPTFGVARFEVSGDWADVNFGCGHLELLTSPKRLNRDAP
ncbi:MAG: histidine phosphatase family protein [Gammaproteobacteria bacterium]|nr:histidine phosphatase family protein [Gammaproteobacteria bacterium]